MSLSAAAASFHAATQAFDEELHPGEITINNATYPVSAVKGRKEPIQLEDGGTVVVSPLNITLRKNLFPMEPIRGTKLLFEREPWLIMGVGGRMPADAAWHLVCIPHPSA